MPKPLKVRRVLRPHVTVPGQSKRIRSVVRMVIAQMLAEEGAKTERAASTKTHGVVRKPAGPKKRAHAASEQRYAAR